MPSVRASASKASRASSSPALVYDDPAGVFPIAVLRAGAGIVEPGRNAVHVAGLAVVVLQHVAVAAVQHAGPAEAERGGMVAGLVGSSARLDAHQLHRLVGHERIEHAGRVAASAHAGHDHVGQPAELLQALRPRLPADDRLKIADDPREGMRPDDRAENVMRRFDRAHPVAEGLVDGVAQGARAAGDRPDLGPQQLHAEDVGPLAADVFLAHVDDAFQAESGTGRGGGHAVLAGAGLGDHPALAHPLRSTGPGRACC